MNKPLRPGEIHPGVGRIGPNAVTRLAQALEGDQALRIAVFRRAGCLGHLASPPTEMVDERDVSALHQALQEVAGERKAEAVSREAGRLTADYLLANRIPSGAQRLLKVLPRALGERILVRAIGRHAWTFSGSGRFRHGFEPHLVMEIENSPVARLVSTRGPACSYYAVVFERVFSAAIGRPFVVRETRCAGTGHSCCRFELKLHS